jgi:hypothetical protein
MLIRWNRIALDEERKSMYRVYKYNTCCVLEGVDKIRKNKEAYDLWIDVPLKEFREKEKGDIDLLQKRILGRLLLFLIINASKDYTPTELYRQVWCLKPNDRRALSPPWLSMKSVYGMDQFH